MTVDRSVIRELEAIVGAEHVRTDPGDLEPYSRDATPTFRAVPDAVGNPPGDHLCDIVGCGGSWRPRRVGRLDREVDGLDRQLAVAEHIRHGRVELGDYGATSGASSLGSGR